MITFFIPQMLNQVIAQRIISFRVLQVGCTNLQVVESEALPQPRMGGAWSMKDRKIFIHLILNNHIMHNDTCIHDIGHIGGVPRIYKDVQSWTI